MFELTVKGERKFFAALDRLAEAAADVRETPEGWQPHVDLRLDYERRHLDSEGAGGWAPLNDAYAGWKQERVGDRPILYFSGRMDRSLTEEGAAGYVRDEAADSLQVGTSDLKARRHHEGKGVPERPVIVVTPQEADDHLLAFHDAYEATARAAGFRVI